MFADSQEPDTSSDEKNGGEKEESQVEIYEDVNTLEQSPADSGSREVRALTQNYPSAVKRSPFGATAVILGVMYLLIVAAVCMRYVIVTLEKQNLVRENEQLNISLNQTLTRNMNLTEEINKLQTRYDDLNKRWLELRGGPNNSFTYYLKADGC